MWDVRNNYSRAFEAMFLESGTELKYKLALRVSKFLSNQYDPLHVFDFMRKSYDIRSNVVHGALLKAKDYKLGPNSFKMSEYLKFLRVMLRDSIKLYCTSYGNLSFEELNKKIDRAIVSSSPKV